MNISDKNLDPICFVEISIWWDNGCFYSAESTLDTVQNMQIAQNDTFTLGKIGKRYCL